MRGRTGAALAISGVASFIVAWVVLGALRKGYSPMEDAISQLAELGAPRRELMTAGIIAFGVGSLAFAPSLGGRAGIALAVAGVGSMGVAAYPCTEGCPGAGELTDTGHAVAAGIHYAAFVAAPLLASRDRSVRIAAVAAALALAMHVVGIGPNGLMQRLGLTTLDAWLVSVAFERLRNPRGKASATA